MVAICSVVAFLVVLAAAPAALGADYQVAASPNGTAFSPNDLTVAPGDKVTISYAGGAFAHNSKYADQPACPLTPTTSAWSCPRTFSSVGDYSFRCELHTTMTGTVHVVDPSSGGSPPGSTPPGGTPPAETAPGGEAPAADVSSPGVTLGGAGVQRVLRKSAVVVKVQTSEAAALTATGRVSVPPRVRVFPLQKVTAASTAGEVVTLKLRLSRRARVAVKKALALRRKPSASVRISATDGAGNRTVKSRRIALRG